MSSIVHLISVFDAYREATGLAEATVSTKFMGRGSRSAELRAGGDMGALQVEKIIRKFAAVWPPDRPWPAEVERPDVESVEPARA